MKTILVCALLVIAAQAQAEPRQIYSARITNLGMMGGIGSEAKDINESGNIVITAYFPADYGYIDERGFLHSNGVSTQLLPGLTDWQVTANGINDSNDIVGKLQKFGSSYAYRLAGGTLYVLPSDYMSEDDKWGDAVAISNSGKVIGVSSFPGPVWPCMWLGDGTRVQMEPDAEWYSPQDVNASATIAGYTDDIAAVWKWSPSAPMTKTQIPMPHWTSTTFYLESYAYGINDKGHVVGAVGGNETSGEFRRPFFWKPSAYYMEVLPGLPGYTNGRAIDVNEEGFVIGASHVLIEPTALYPDHAFIFHADFGAYALPTLPGITDFCTPAKLNERNVRSIVKVVGKCVDANGTRRAVLWEVEVPTPRS